MIFIRKKIFIFLIVSVAIAFVAWQFYKKTQTKLDPQTIAIVDTVAIKTADFEKRLNNTKLNYSPEYAEANLSKLKNGVLKRMIIETLVIEEAKKRDIVVSNEELDRYIKNITSGYSKTELDQFLFNQFKSYDEWAEEIKNKLLIEKVMPKMTLEKVDITEEQIKEYYKTHYEGKATSPKVKLAQVFTVSKDKAQQALDEIKTGEDFGKVAKKYSESPEAKSDGIIGMVSKGDGIEVFDKAFEMEDQAISGIIQSEYGFHILKVLAHVPASEIRYEDVKPFITAELARQKESTMYETWLSERIKRAKIVKNKPLLNSIR